MCRKKHAFPSKTAHEARSVAHVPVRPDGKDLDIHGGWKPEALLLVNRPINVDELIVADVPRPHDDEAPVPDAETESLIDEQPWHTVCYGIIAGGPDHYRRRIDLALSEIEKGTAALQGEVFPARPTNSAR